MKPLSDYRLVNLSIIEVWMMKKNFMKKLGLATMTTVAALSLAACGSKANSSSANDKTTTITFWNGFTSTDGDVLKSIVKTQSMHGVDG
jgi:ABC-type oligopeptide transport system substrate-binding subunit